MSRDAVSIQHFVDIHNPGKNFHYSILKDFVMMIHFALDFYESSDADMGLKSLKKIYLFRNYYL